MKIGGEQIGVNHRMRVHHRITQQLHESHHIKKHAEQHGSQESHRRRRAVHHTYIPELFRVNFPPSGIHSEQDVVQYLTALGVQFRPSLAEIRQEVLPSPLPEKVAQLFTKPAMTQSALKTLQKYYELPILTDEFQDHLRHRRPFRKELENALVHYQVEQQFIEIIGKNALKRNKMTGLITALQFLVRTSVKEESRTEYASLANDILAELGHSNREFDASHSLEDKVQLAYKYQQLVLDLFTKLAS